MASLLSSGRYNDFTIECKGRVFKVHKAVICPQSDVFTAALEGEFEASYSRKSTSDVIC